MSMWAWILLASLVAYATKLSGYLVPARWLETPRMTRVAGTLTIGLLASLTARNTFSAGQGLVVDAPVLALLAAGVAWGVGVPFLGGVAGGAGRRALAGLAGSGGEGRPGP